MFSGLVRRLVGLALCLALSLVSAVHAEVAIPSLMARVTDLSGTLTVSQRSALESELQAIETRSSAQIAILMLPTTRPETIEQYSIRVVEAWKLGQKGKDNGVLLLVAKDDRKVRIEVGYGLEGSIPDAFARQIIDGLITPRFKQGDFAGGLTEAVRQLALLIEGRAAADQAVAASATASATEDASAGLPALGGELMDLAGLLDESQVFHLRNTLRERGLDRGKPFYVLIVPSTAPDTIAQYGARVLAHWGAHDNLDVARSGILVIAADSRKAHIELGPSLHTKWAADASETICPAKGIVAKLRNDIYAFLRRNYHL